MDTFESSGRTFSDGGGNDLGESARMDEDSGSGQETLGEDLLSTENSQPEINIFYDYSEDDTCALCLCAGPHLPTFGPCDACDCLEYVPVWSLDDDDCSTLLDKDDSLEEEYNEYPGELPPEDSEEDLLDDEEEFSEDDSEYNERAEYVALYPPDEDSGIATNADELYELAGVEIEPDVEDPSIPKS